MKKNELKARIEKLQNELQELKHSCFSEDLELSRDILSKHGHVDIEYVMGRSRNYCFSEDTFTITLTKQN